MFWWEETRCSILLYCDQRQHQHPKYMYVAEILTRIFFSHLEKIYWEVIVTEGMDFGDGFSLSRKHYATKCLFYLVRETNEELIAMDRFSIR